MSQTYLELTFTYSKSHKFVFICLFSILLLFSSGFLIPLSFIFYDQGFVAISFALFMILMMISVGVIYKIFALLCTKLIILNNQIIFRKTFKYQIFDFENIQYYQAYFISRKEVICVVDQNNNKMKIDSYLKNFESIEKFLRMNFKTFDQFYELSDYVIEDPNFIKNKTFKCVKFYIDFAVVFCCISLFVYPNEFIYLIFQLSIFAYIFTLLFCNYSNGKKNQGTLNRILIMLVLSNCIYIFYYKNSVIMFLNNQYFLYFFCFFIVLFSTVLFCTFLSIRPIKNVFFPSFMTKMMSLFFLVIGVGCVSIFPSRSLVQTLNSVGDNKIIAIEKYLILDKARVGNARRETIFLEGQSVNKNIRILVSNDKYTKLRVGGVYGLHVRKGNLGINWAKID